MAYYKDMITQRIFFEMLQNEISRLGRNLPLATFDSERVKLYKE